MQVTDVKILRKVKNSLSETRYVKVADIFNNVGVLPADEMLTEIIEVVKLPRVRENGNMVALLQEMKALLEAANFDGATAVAKRVLEVPAAVATPAPRGVKA